MILFYRIFSVILYPILYVSLLIRILKKKEDPKRYREKIFINSFNAKKLTNLKLLWFHAASVGEFKSIIPIIENLNSRQKKYEFLITTNTLSSSKLAEIEIRKFNNVQHRFMPFDLNHLIENFLNQWKPEKIFLVDSEIWPNLILKAKQKKIPIALINARLTRKSFGRWLVFYKTAKAIFGVFDLCLCSNKETKYFLKKLNAKNIVYVGNIKLIDEIDSRKIIDKKTRVLSQLRFWVAASTHKEEDIFCLKTHVELKKTYSDIKTFIAPRHLNRTSRIVKLSNSFNLRTQILNRNDEIYPENDVVIINSFGVLQKFFLYAKSVFIGKSIIKKLKNDSGQNPIEAAKLNCKIYHGPYVTNFKEIYEILKIESISTEIENFKELSKYLIEDLRNPQKEKLNGSNSIQNLGKQILIETIDVIKKYLND